MKVLLLGLNYAPEKVGIAVYTTGMAEALVGAGHEVRVVAGRPYYPAWKVMPGYGKPFSRAVEGGVDVLRVPHYIPADPSGFKRILHHVSFGLAALVPLLRRAIGWRPDVVLVVAPSLLAAPLGRLAAKVCGAPAWLHVQDFEVEAAFATGLLRGGWFSRSAAWFEKAVMGRFDVVSTISPQMCRKLINKGVAPRRVAEFRNWAEAGAIRPLKTQSIYRDLWNIKTRHVALYAGNIGNKQGIEIIIEAARLLRHREDLTFVVCGEGPNRAALMEVAAGLTNIEFHDLQPSERLNELLGLATVHLLPQRAEAEDLVLPSKLNNMLASGRPVAATASAGTGLAAEVEGCGRCTAPGDVNAFAQAIAGLLDDAAKRKALGLSARRRAEERWQKEAILGAFIGRLEMLVEARALRAWRVLEISAK